MSWNPEHVESRIKLTIAVSFCITIMSMVILSMYSLVFVPQPMNGIAPADKQFFFLLSDMSKYILGSLGTLLAIKGKDAIQEMMPPKEEPPKATDGPAS
jgi:hypothetical protein